MSSPCTSIVWASAGTAVSAPPIAAILPSAIDQGAARDVGAADRVQGRPDECVDPLGMRRSSSSFRDRTASLGPGMATWSPGRGAKPLSFSSRWNQTSPSIRASSQRAKASNGWRVEQGDVGVLAHLDRAEPRVEAQLAGRVDGDHLQRLGLGHAAVLDHLGRLEVEVADQLLAVALDADAGAGLDQERGVVGDGVVRLDLVGPPVGEGRGAGAVGGDLGGDLVAFEHVLERLDPDAVPLRPRSGASGSRPGGSSGSGS